MDAIRELGLSVAPATVVGERGLASAYPVSDLASAAVGAAGSAVAGLLVALGHAEPAARVRRELAEAWFRSPLDPVGWAPPPAWDALAGDYRARDGWVRLHTNAPHHRRAALRALGLDASAEREVVEAAVAALDADEVEQRVVEAGGAAAALRSAAAWAAHPQGRAVADEPLVARVAAPAGEPRPASASTWRPAAGRPLAGLRVLDLTRVLAGPTATQLLAGLGAEVLRVDPPDWDEPGVLPIVMSGKRAARLDARTPAGSARLVELLAGADVLVHGLRPGALEGLGLDLATRHRIRPGIVEVALDAYGFTGPWAGRRGFDSLVQMSSGIADTGMRAAGAAPDETDPDAHPAPLPVQALDFATGYLVAAAALAGLAERLREGGPDGSGAGSIRRLSLARTAVELERMRAASATADNASPAAVTQAPILDPIPDPTLVATAWGPARRLAPPLEIDGVEFDWPVEAGPLGRHPAEWAD
ncbi:CoA transferase [Schumannella sp. 10F1B-5-1]|uniref:CoA transferase n=1 Tax=Schumannella sp. 10F1B-5-1 TaxID=2590780 RepID=UPI0011301176|nr:CoA transferase [Schumannella sp. 10F1B-5-1]TPW73023.1 acyl-CoA transferase [Schumannella sp. 10F1B-5-1]